MSKRSESFKWPNISAWHLGLFEKLVIHEKIFIELCRLSTLWLYFIHSLLYYGIFICLTVDSLSGFCLLFFEATIIDGIDSTLCFSWETRVFLLFLLFQANDYLRRFCSACVSDVVRSMLCSKLKVRNEIFILNFWKAQSWGLWNNMVSSILNLTA